MGAPWSPTGHSGMEPMSVDRRSATRVPVWLAYPATVQAAVGCTALGQEPG
jgi:hypothetical protein